MKHVQLIGIIAAALFLASCESTRTTGMGNQESKRLAAIHQEQQDQEPDEAKRNLWNAQHDILTRDGNPASHYY